jgi:cytochrome c556
MCTRSLTLTVAATVAFLSAIGHSPAVPPEDNKDIPKPKIDDKPRIPLPKGHELMAAKLKESQAVLAGIALGDYEAIEKATVALNRITQAAAFLNAGKSKEYEVQMTLFRRSVETVKLKAKDKNMDGVMLGYIDMQLSCMKCHQHTRDNKPDARLPQLPNSAEK